MRELAGRPGPMSHRAGFAEETLRGGMTAVRAMTSLRYRDAWLSLMLTLATIG
ncbi:hypothetical protein BRAS3843_670038 [Bradyrhizobium sp. STM 3843]|nr:hypothetical protein BRAS3843_670038 [Bradyrhizobium sp. STM 3843]